MIFKKRTRDDPRPELTSLVDIIFILVLFLTVTTTFATSGGINVNLPEASSQQPLEKAEKLFIIINRDGQAFIEGERMSDLQLAERFKAMAEKDPGSVVVLQADKTTLHGRVVAVMDLAQTAGLKRLAIATEQKSGEAPGPETVEPATPEPPGTPAPAEGATANATGKQP